MPNCGSHSTHRESKIISIHYEPIAWDYIPQWIPGECLRDLYTYTQVNPFVFGGKLFCVQSDKAHIARIQETFNHELDEVEGTCGSAYIAGITDAAAINGYACTIGIFLLSLEITHNHGVEIFLKSREISSNLMMRKVFVPSVHWFLGTFDPLQNPWHSRTSSLAWDVFHMCANFGCSRSWR